MKHVIIVFLAFTLFACEEVPIEINDVVIDPTQKVVLIEELTGAKCPNCPKGTKAIENILTKYPDNVVAVGIHGKFLSEPARSGDPDFRNEDGENLENWFKPWFGKPSATANRIKDNFGSVMNDSPDLWESLVEAELQKPQQMNLFMEVKYDETSRNIDIEIAANPLVDLAGDYNITVYVTESHIIAGQANGSEIIDEYEHNHVLREIITNYSGDFFAGNMTKGQIIKKNFNYTLPAVNGKLNHAEHTSIVAFIHKSGANNRDVLQAVSKYLTK